MEVKYRHWYTLARLAEKVGGQVIWWEGHSKGFSHPAPTRLGRCKKTGVLDFDPGTANEGDHLPDGQVVVLKRFVRGDAVHLSELFMITAPPDRVEAVEAVIKEVASD